MCIYSNFSIKCYATAHFKDPPSYQPLIQQRGPIIGKRIKRFFVNQGIDTSVKALPYHDFVSKSSGDTQLVEPHKAGDETVGNSRNTAVVRTRRFTEPGTDNGSGLRDDIFHFLDFFYKEIENLGAVEVGYRRLVVGVILR